MGYYMGDPGFLSSFGKVFGAVGSFLPGVGGIAGKIGGALSKLGTTKVGQAIVKHPTLSAAGGAALTGMGMGAAASPIIHRMGAPAAMGPAGATARGFHMSKPRKGVPPHLVRNRRMRVTNPRALRRAIRRARGFERMARKVMHFVSPRAHKGRAVFRVRKRSSK